MSESPDQNKQTPSPKASAGASQTKSAGALAAGNITAMVLRLAGGIILVKFLSPTELGTINGVGLVMVYASFLQLGAINGLNRELPFYLGTGDRDRAYDLASCTFAWALACGVVAGTAAFAWAGWEAMSDHGDLAVVWVAYGLALVLFYPNLYLKATFRTSAEFVKLALCHTITAVGAFILLGVVWKTGFRGQCFRLGTIAVIEIFLLWRWRPIRVTARFKWSQWLHLIKIGLPIFGVGYFYSVWRSMDRAYILKALGREQLGFYQLATLTRLAGMSITIAVSQIIYPRMAHAYGKHGDRSMLLKVGRKPLKLLLVLAIPVLIGAWFAIEPIVQWLVPRYLPGVPAAKWTLVDVYLLCFTPQFAVFNVMKKQIHYAIAMGAGLGTFVLSAAFLPEINSDPLVSFAQAMAMGTAVFVLLAYVMAYRLTRPEKAATGDQTPTT